MLNPTDPLIGNDPTEKMLASAHLRHVRGVPEILAHQALLQEFAAATGQRFAMHGLQFKLEHEYSRRKTPHLFFIVSGRKASAPPALQSLLGCVLLFEYRLGFWNTGFFATGDSTGVGTVVAHPQVRAHIATLASATALRHGHMVLACFRDELESSDPAAFESLPDQRRLWSAQAREIRDRLCLGPTYDRTLETLGKRTRTHLRYYRKRLHSETGCVFVPDAAAQIPDSEYASLNASSLEPVSPRMFDMQFRTTANQPNGYVRGLRAPDGRWLCLAGGWRQGPLSVIEWQLNAAGFPRHSLSTALRAFLIEYEVSLGTRQLCFHGGTMHSIHHAFQKDRAVDLLLRRPGPFLSIFTCLISWFARRNPALANRGNLLIDALSSPHIEWKHLSTGSPPVLAAGRPAPASHID
jgi:hypothetical protein